MGTLRERLEHGDTTTVERIFARLDFPAWEKVLLLYAERRLAEMGDASASVRYDAQILHAAQFCKTFNSLL